MSKQRIEPRFGDLPSDASDPVERFVVEPRAFEQIQGGFQAAARSLRIQQAPSQDSRGRSAQGRWLNKNCEDWRNAFVANPLPTTREAMLRHCHAYERYLATGQVGAEFSAPGP